jgi:Tol biopolymer transport system component
MEKMNCARVSALLFVFAFLFVSQRALAVISTPVYLASNGVSGAPGNGHARNLSLSADGRYIAFESEAYNLVSGDTNGATDVFVYDTVAGTTVRASVANDGSQGNSSSSNPMISGNGQFVTFVSSSTNFGASNGCTNIYVRDLVNHTTSLVSLGTSGVQANGGSDVSELSAP